MVEIEGFVAPGFEGVREAFARNFERHGEVGAAAAVYVEGRPVVDLWGGLAEPSSGRPWVEDTLQLVFSTTKGATAACANLLAQRGLLDVDAPVADYWPEFAQAGKAAVPVRWLLSHKAGLPWVDATLTLDEVLAWTPIVEALERQAPAWEPGTAHGYHATTFGWLVGEVIRRIDGRSLGRFFADEIAGPLGLDWWIGLPADQHHRVAPLIGTSRAEPEDPELAALIEQFMGPDTDLGKALRAPAGVFSEEGVFNRPEVWTAEIPAANGIADARSVARCYAGLIGTVQDGPSEPILTGKQVDLARELQTSGPDRLIFFDTTFGLGFMTASPFAPFGGAGAFGHPGMGGSVGCGDPEAGVGFGYVMNKMQLNLSGDPRTRGLLRAVYDAIGVEPAFV